MTLAETPKNIEPLHGWTEAELVALPHVGKTELVNGKIIMSPTYFDHGFFVSVIFVRLGAFVMDHRLGVVVDSSTGFRMKEENVRSPDVSFIEDSRFEGKAYDLHHFFAGAPDLAVEVLSDGDTEEEIAEKIREYFGNGTRMAWIVHPRKQKVDLYLSENIDHTAGIDGTVSGGDVVPGFSISVAEIFRPYRRGT